MASGQLHEVDVALELLGQHHKDHARRLLRDHGLAISGSREALLDRVRDAIRRGVIGFDQLVALLDEVEEHGHHHVFLYTLTPPQRTALADIDHVKSLATKHGLATVLNARTRVVDMPSEPVCTSVRHDSHRLRMKWVERRVWEEALPGRDRVEGAVRWRALQRHEARAVNTLRVDLAPGEVQLRVSDAGKQSRTDYANKLTEYAAATAWLLDWDALQRIPIEHAIPPIKLAEEEVRVRGNTYFTVQGTKASFTSDAADSDVRSDRVYQAGDVAAQRDGQDHRLLNVYWLPREGTPLTREVHTYLYADGLGNEVRFSADCTEEEVSYVLSRIREFARA